MSDQYVMVSLQDNKASSVNQLDKINMLIIYSNYDTLN